MKKYSKISSILLAFVLAFAFVLNFAQPVRAASVSANVITQIKYKYSDSTYVQKFKYNSYGLLTEMTTYQPDGTVQLNVKYTYSGNLVKNVVISEFGTKRTTVTNTYGTNGQLTKRVSKITDGTASATTKYTWSGGNIIKSVMTIKNTGTSSWLPNGSKTTKQYTYNSKGVLSKVKTTYTGDYTTSTQNAYQYDANGFLKKNTYKTSSENGYVARKLVYKNGALVKYRDTDYSGGETYSDVPRTVTTKSVSTTKARAAVIAKQQAEIVNGSYGTDFYLGYDNL